VGQPNASQTATGKNLQQNEELFRTLVDQVRDYAIFLLDPGGYVVSWNMGAERIKGYRAEEIIGKHFSQFYTSEDVQWGKPQALLSEAVRVGRCEDEGWRLRKNGALFW
jgi:PAS domain S-box-containing protein